MNGRRTSPEVREKFLASLALGWSVSKSCTLSVRVSGRRTSPEVREKFLASL
jgi:hypothetical protein